jgi:hypothetical protein
VGDHRKFFLTTPRPSYHRSRFRSRGTPVLKAINSVAAREAMIPFGDPFRSSSRLPD